MAYRVGGKMVVGEGMLGYCGGYPIVYRLDLLIHIFVYLTVYTTSQSVYLCL